MRWASALANCSPSSILDVSASINPLGPPESAIAAIHNSIATLQHYPDPSYHLLRKALGQFHQIDPDWILPGNGAAEILTWIGRELIEQNIAQSIKLRSNSLPPIPSQAQSQIQSQIHLITPAFGDYERALRAFQSSVNRPPFVSHPLPLESVLLSSSDEMLSQRDISESHRKRNPIDLSSVLPRESGNENRPAIALPSQDCLLLNNPHNPSGIMFSAQSIESYCQGMSRVVVDEAFIDFLPPHQQQSVLSRVEAYRNLIVVRSLTKFYSLPGLRIGYAIAHPDLIRRWQEWRDPWPVNTLAEAAAIACLTDTEFQEQTWQWLEKARTQLLQGLLQIPGLCVCPGVANFLLVRADCSVTALQRWLLTHHRILIRDCMSFPELGDRYFRIAVRTLEENERVLHALASGLDVLMNESVQ